MNAPSSARSSKRSLRGRDTRQGTQFGRRGVGTGLGVSSAGDTNSWLWPASRASKSSKAIGPTGLFEGGAALKPARARAAMPKRGCGPTGLPSEPAPKSAAFRVDDARAARDGAWRSQTTASWQPRRSRAPDETSTRGRCWTRPRPADSQPRARSAAKRMRGRLSRVEAPFILSWGAAHTGPPRTSARAIPGAAPLRHGVAGSFWQAGERSNFVRLGGFLPSAGGEGAATKACPKQPHPRRLHGRNGVVRASLLPGRRRAAKSVQVVLQRRSWAAAG